MRFPTPLRDLAFLAFGPEQPRAERIRHRTHRRKAASPLRPVERLEERSCPSGGPYSVTQLPLLPGDTSGYPLAQNNASPVLVAGSSGGYFSRAVLWRQNAAGTFGVQPLGSLGGQHSTARAINGQGQVAGYSQTGAVAPNGDAVEHAFLWQNGVMTDLDTLGNEQSLAYALSENGRVVGTFTTTPTTNGVPNDPHAFVWEQGVMYDINNLLPANSGWVLWSADGVNATQIGGNGLHNGQDRAFRITDPDGIFGNGIASIVDLGPAARVDAMSVDGSRLVGRGASGRATLWQDGVTTNLGTLSKGDSSEAFGLNNAGQIVGTSSVDRFGTPRAFLWQNGQMVDLNGQISGKSTLAMTNAYGVNESGQIIGVRNTSSGVDQAPILLTPTTNGRASVATTATGGTSTPQGPLALPPDATSVGLEPFVTTLLGHRRKGGAFHFSE